MNHQRLFGLRTLALGSILVLVAACHGSESDARAYLERQGLSPTSITKEPGGQFKFTAKKGTNEVCTGSLTIQKSPGSSQQTMTSSCGRDTSACKPGAPAECIAIADELYSKEAKVFPKTAAELYRIACADNKGHACARASEFEAIEKNWPKARELATKGCDLESGEACRRLALMELEGQGAAKNEARAIELAKKGCDLAFIPACRDAAGMMVDATPSQAAAAVPLAEKACKANFEDSCVALGIVLFDTKKDYAAALSHLEPACTTDAKTTSTEGFVCNLAGAILLDGLGGVKKDPVKAIAFLEKSCTKGFAAGCSNAGRMYAGGLSGVPKNKVKGEELLTKACGLGHKSACRPS